MNLLLDTCALLALAGNIGKLPKKAGATLAAATDVHVSLVTLWEVAIKVKTGKLHLERQPEDWFHRTLRLYKIQEIPLSSQLLCQAADLPLIHRDPFDRLLIATARLHNLTILTSDRIIPTYPGVKVVW